MYYYNLIILLTLNHRYIGIDYFNTQYPYKILQNFDLKKLI